MQFPTRNRNVGWQTGLRDITACYAGTKSSIHFHLESRLSSRLKGGIDA
jgi:hypothetical protein